MQNPNVVFVFADQWRYQATGFAGDPNLAGKTPNLDALAAESLQFENAISGTPVCCPARASLMTGQQPLTHGVFLNDVSIRDDAVMLGQAFKAGGYDTGYIGKWHIGGRGRSAPIAREHRGGFDYWRALECTHTYWKSLYYADDETTPRQWEGYDAEAQTRDAQQYIRTHAGADRPFLLMLSWGPPHSPYQDAPPAYLERVDELGIALRPNVPAEHASRARWELRGYYAHILALDDYLGDLRATLREAGVADNTLFVFWSDHGDMLGSQGRFRKQKPWEESIRVPLLMHCPALFGPAGRTIAAPIDTVDLMPTLLELCGLPVPETVEGLGYAEHLRGKAPAPREAVVIASYHPFGEWNAPLSGGVAYRGLRDRRYTYVETLDGPWLLYDNQTDPWQVQNLIDDPAQAGLQQQCGERLKALLEARGDRFEPGDVYVKRWGYAVDERGTIPIV